MLRNVPFPRHLITVEQSSQDRFRRVQGVICQPPYINWWFPEYLKSEHRRINPQDMGYCMKLTWAVRYAPMNWKFCFSVLQFKSNFEQLVCVIKDVVKEEIVEESEEVKSLRLTSLWVKVKGLHYVPATDMYQKYSKMTCLAPHVCCRESYLPTPAGEVLGSWAPFWCSGCWGCQSVN